MADIDWDALRSFCPELPRGFDYGRQRYTGSHDLEALLRLARAQRPRRVLELYTAEGDTSLALARACPNAEVVTVDIVREMGIGKPTGEVPDHGTVGRSYRNAPERDRIRSVVDDPRTIHWMDMGRFDVVYIDGDHSYEGVLLDTALSVAVAEPDGLLVWDDYWDPCPGVIQFIDELNHPFNWLTLVHGTRIVFAVLTLERAHWLRERIDELSTRSGIDIPAAYRVPG